MTDTSQNTKFSNDDKTPYPTKSLDDLTMTKESTNSRNVFDEKVKEKIPLRNTTLPRALASSTLSNSDTTSYSSETNPFPTIIDVIPDDYIYLGEVCDILEQVTSSASMSSKSGITPSSLLLHALYAKLIIQIKSEIQEPRYASKGLHRFLSQNQNTTTIEHLTQMRVPVQVGAILEGLNPSFIDKGKSIIVRCCYESFQVSLDGDRIFPPWIFAYGHDLTADSLKSESYFDGNDDRSKIMLARFNKSDVIQKKVYDYLDGNNPKTINRRPHTKRINLSKAIESNCKFDADKDFYANYTLFTHTSFSVIRSIIDEVNEWYAKEGIPTVRLSDIIGLDGKQIIDHTTYRNKFRSTNDVTSQFPAYMFAFSEAAFGDRARCIASGKVIEFDEEYDPIKVKISHSEYFSSKIYGFERTMIPREREIVSGDKDKEMIPNGWSSFRVRVDASSREISAWNYLMHLTDCCGEPMSTWTVSDLIMILRR